MIAGAEASINKYFPAELERILISGPSFVHGSWQACFAPDKNFVGFSGHFPEHPVLPALAQLVMAQHVIQLAQPTRGFDIKLLEIQSAKFTEQGKPEEYIFVSGKIRPGKEGAKQSETSWDFSLYHSADHAALEDIPVDPAKSSVWHDLSSMRLRFELNPVKQS